MSVAAINATEGLGTTLQGSVSGAGQVITGGTKSEITFTIWLQSAKLPQASMALQVKVYVTKQPAVEVLVLNNPISGVPQLSVAVITVGEAVGTELHGRVTGPGQVITGGSVSMILEYVCVHDDEWPH